VLDVQRFHRAERTISLANPRIARRNPTWDPKWLTLMTEILVETGFFMARQLRGCYVSPSSTRSADNGFTTLPYAPILASACALSGMTEDD
jgi:hypothetical protein